MRRGFTLIELLVVIAIIAILAAILFPVYARLKDSARKTVCLSNVKQLGTAVLTYMDDYDSHYPVCHLNYDGLTDGVTGKSRNSERCLLDRLWEYVKSSDIFFCPSDTTMGIPTQMDNNRLGHKISYGWNETLNGANSAGLTPGQIETVTIENQTGVRPHRVGMIMDLSPEWHSGGDWKWGGIHKRAVWNMVFADGHASTCIKTTWGSFLYP